MLVTLPPTLESRSFNAPGQQWDCVFHSPSWTCVNGLAPGQVAEPLHLNAGVVGGAPGDVLTVTAQATTPDRELSTTNNSGQASVNLIAAGTIRGTVWVDGVGGSLDGQREPSEAVIPSLSSLYWIRIHTEDGSQVIRADANDQGQYAVALKPGRYFVEVLVVIDGWGFTTPNVGDEALDSDVTPVSSPDGETVARSDVVEVTGGSETVIDVGLTEPTTA